MARKNALVGIGLLLGSTLAFTIMAALIRYIGERVPLGEIVFARSVDSVAVAIATSRVLWGDLQY